MPDEGPLQEDLTETQLQKGYWYVTHIVAIKKRIVAVSIGVISLIWLGALISFVILYLLHLPSYRLTLDELKTSLAHAAPSPLTTPLSPSPISLLSRQTVDATLYNLFLEIENPNASYRADFEGVFTSLSGKTYSVKEFLMPGEKKYVFALSLREDPGAPTFEIRNTTWTRLPRKVLSEVAQ
ncbi:MAG: hypothetical protein Q7R79_00150, partial [bacterium]|nr:hypothetical protein [bacterium]